MASKKLAQTLHKLAPAGAGPGVSGPLVGAVLVTHVGALAYNMFVLHTVNHLRHTPDCPCVRDWKLDFVRNYTLFISAWLVGVLLVGLIQPAALAHPVFVVVSNLVSVLSIVNLVLALQYVQGLRRGLCKCSASASRSVWEVLLWVQAGLVALNVLVMLLAVLTVGVFIARSR